MILSDDFRRQVIEDALAYVLKSSSLTPHEQELVRVALAGVISKTADEIGNRLDVLGDYRMDYVGLVPTNHEEIEALGTIRAMIYGEATGAKHLAKIVRGELSDHGWLPSWRWDWKSNDGS